MNLMVITSTGQERDWKIENNKMLQAFKFIVKKKFFHILVWYQVTWQKKGTKITTVKS